MAKKKKEEKLSVTKSDNILLENSLDTDKIKEDLEKYVDEKINQAFIDELDKTNRKLLREKSRKIFVKNIVIIILLLIIGFLIYLLYSNNYFDKFFNNNPKVEDKIDIKEEETKKDDEEKKEEVVKEPTLDELKKEYAILLDNYVISDKSSYLSDFYNGDLNNNLKNYFTLNSLDFDTLKKEDDYEIISNDIFKIAYEKLFNDDYISNSFDYNGNIIRYVNMMSSYITTSLLKKEESLIKREISDIKVDGNTVIITTIEGIVKDNKLYKIIDNLEVEDYNEDSLLKHSDRLNKVIYTFKSGKLTNLSK